MALQLKSGDTVAIRVDYTWRQGVIDTVEGKEGDWMIQLTDPEHGAVYWKQHSDGGRVELLKVGPHIQTFAEKVVEIRDKAGSITNFITRLILDVKGIKIVWGKHIVGEPYDCQSAELIYPSCPPVTMFYFTFWDDNHYDFATLILINDEAGEFDAYLHRMMQQPQVRKGKK